MHEWLGWLATAGISPGSTDARALAEPDERSRFHSELVTLARCTEVWEAHILRARLEAEGITAIIADQHVISANWFYSNALGGVRIQVPAPQLGRARDILAALERGEFALTAEPSDIDTAALCPRCGSTAVGEQASGRKLALVSVWLVQIPLPFSRWRNRCQHCGHSWRSVVPAAKPAQD